MRWYREPEIGLTERYRQQVYRRASLSRTALIIEGFYFLIVSVVITDLAAFPAFIAAGVSCIVAVVLPTNRLVVAALLGLVGAACFWSMYALVFDPDQSTVVKISGLGWILPWLLAIVCIIHINAAAALKRSETWTG